jgi:cytochrome c oxidase accessory protein FixG
MSEEQVSFRDRPINMNEKGGRKWVYAKKPKGKWYFYRTIVSVVVLAFLVLAPFIKYKGYPLILLDIVNRKFIIFGAIFWAQDTFLLALIMLSFVVFVIVFTVTFGRLWCGWLCPQTIFLEMVFRKIEYLIEGDFRQRLKLDNSPWTAGKIFRKVLKHTIFIIIAILMTNVFLIWFTGPQRLLEIATTPIRENLTPFLIMLFVSGIFYFIYAFFREQICTMVCPYGRMQSVLLDSKSLIVTYDFKRGEPRGHKNGGDCIDCEQCIAVCPTGIDIRNGTQLECVNCAACIDECNNVMKKVKRPQNLIRFDSMQNINTGKRVIFTGRTVAYSVVLVALLGFFIYSIASRKVIETTILRTPGIIYQENADSTISNVYNLEIVNKSHQNIPLELRLLSHKGKIVIPGGTIEVKDQSKFESAFILYIPKNELKSDKTKVEFGLYDKDKLIEKYTATFVGP